MRLDLKDFDAAIGRIVAPWRSGESSEVTWAVAGIGPLSLEIRHLAEGTIGWIRVDAILGGGVSLWRSRNEKTVPLDEVIDGMVGYLRYVSEETGAAIESAPNLQAQLDAIPDLVRGEDGDRDFPDEFYQSIGGSIEARSMNKPTHITISRPTIAEVEAVWNFIEYFDELHSDGELHLLDFGGPSEIAGRFEPIAHCWKRVLLAAPFPTISPIAQPDQPGFVLGGADR